MALALAILSCSGPRGLPPRQIAPPESTPPERAPREFPNAPDPSVTGQRLAEVLAEAGCAGCHRAEGHASKSRLIFPPPGASFQAYESVSAKFWDLVNAEDPKRSRLFLKPTQRTRHAGGERITPGSPEEGVLLAWLTEAGKGPRTARELREILVAPGPALAWPATYRGRPSLLRRLSRDEVMATVKLLVGAAPPRADLPEEPREGHGFLVTVGVPLLANELRKLHVVISDFAEKMAPELLTQSSCTLTENAQRECLSSWASGLAARAFRRSPAVEEEQSLRELFATAGVSQAGDVASVEAALVPIFFSASFLYREELGAAIPGELGIQALSPNEIASRLAFMATLAPPDAELREAAAAGRLLDPKERVRQSERLLATELGRRAQVLFVLEWLGANETKIDSKSDKYRRDLGESFDLDIRTSAEQAISRVLFESADPTVAALLSTNSYLADEAMQKISQPSGKGKRLAGDDEHTDRIGLMMHPQVLAAHTKENGSSPFQLGAFMREAFLCEPVPPPPANASALARKDEPKGLSTRASLEYRTSAGPVCVACHQTFAPLGYAFLPFDPVGRWVQQDPSGLPWELAGKASISSGASLRFATPAELIRSLASSPQVHGCFAQAALQWTLGRALVPFDQPMLSVLSEVATKTRGNLPAIFRAIVASPDFVKVVARR